MDNPTDIKAFESLQDALITEGRLPELKEIYEMVFPAVQDAPERDRILRVVDHRARTTEDLGVRHWLNAQLGLLFWKQLDNPDRAEVYFRRVQDAAGQTGMVGEFYTEFYARRDNWRRLEQLYAAQGFTTIEVKRKLAEVAEAKGRKDKALSFWQAVFNEDTSDSETYQKLKGLYGEVGKWHSLVELLKSRLKGLDDVEAQIEVHLEMISIFREHIKSDTKVISAWQQVLKLQPNNRKALDALQTVYTRMKRWPDLVRILQGRVKTADSDEEALALHREIATLMLERFSNSSEAIKHFNAILEIDADNLEALGSLKGLYEQRKSWEQFVDVSQREISLSASGPAERSAALIELAALASERIRHPRIATKLWEEIYENDPDNPDALHQLQSLYEREKAFPKLVVILDALVDKADDTPTRVKLLEKLGQIWGARLQNDEKTAQVWKRVLELDPGHRKAFSEMRKRAIAALDLDSLDWLFRNHGTIAELIRTLESQLKGLDERARLPIHAKVAGLWREEGQTARAVRSLEGIREIDPGNVGAARELIPIYEELEHWEKLPDVYDVVIDAAEEADQRDLQIAQARVHENHLQDLDAAFFCFVNAFQLDHGDGEIRAELDRLAEASENWDTYVNVVEQTIELLRDVDEVQTAMLKVASVYHTRLQQHDQALGFYKRILAMDESNAPALAATEAIYRETARWDELIDVLHDKLRLGLMSDDDEKSLRFEIAAVWRDELQEPEAAMGMYREMMDRFPDDLRIYDELASLHMQVEDWVQLADVLEHKLASLADNAESSPSDLADLHCKLGMLAYSQAEDTGQAVDHYIDALHADAECDLAVQSLVELLTSDDHRDQIALALEPVYNDRGMHPQLADVLEIQLLSATTKKARTGLLERLVKLYDGVIGDGERALWASSRLFELTPDKKALHSTIGILAERLGEWQHLADLYESNIDSVKKDTVRLSLYETIAQTAQNHLDDAERAERVYRLILDLEPEHAETLDALEYLYMETDQPEKLLEILRTKASLLGDDDEVIDNLFQTASILADRLDRTEEAIDDVRQILGIVPEHDMALARLDELYTRIESWQDLHDVIMQRIGLADSDETKASLLVRLGGLRETCLEAPEDAIETYAEILSINVLQEDAKVALERLFNEPAHAPTIAPLLEKPYSAAGDWQGLIRVYTVMEAEGADSDERVQLHFKMARLYEQQGEDHGSAFNHFGQAYLLVPEREDTIEQLLRLADVLGNHLAMADLLRERVDDIGDPDRRRETHRIVAGTLRDRCNDPDGAIDHFRSVLEINQDDAAAVDALAELYRAREDWPNLVELLLIKAGLADSDEWRKELLIEAGDIAAASLDEPGEAIAIYEQVLDLDDAEDRALDALGTLYRNGEDWTSLSRILGRKVELIEDVDERKTTARELAEVQESRMEDLEGAIDTRRLILSWDDADGVELKALDDLLSRTENWLDLLSVLDRRIALLEAGSSGANDLMLRKAQIWSEKLEDTTQAIGVLAEILAEDVTEARAVDALEVIVQATDEREQAFEVLGPFLELNEEWGRTYMLVDTLVEHRDDPMSRIEGLHRMGALAEESMQDPERAFACYGRAVHEMLDHEPSMAAVERLARGHNLWERLTLLLADAASNADDPRQALTLRLRAAEILKVELGDRDRAIQTYRQVLEDEEDNLVALESLDDLYVATDRFEDLVGVLERQIDVADDVDHKVSLFFRLADVTEHRLGDEDKPWESYREVFWIQPDNADAIEHLERLAEAGVHRIDIATLLEPVYVDKEQWSKLHAMLELRLEVTEDELDRLDLLRRLAHVNLENLDDKVAAVRWFSEAFRADPMDDGLLGTLETLTAETSEWETLKAALLACAIGLDDDPERKVVLWHKGAKILEDHLLDPAQAEMIYKLVLGTEPLDLAALQALDRMYVSQERWEELYAALEQQTEAVDFEDDRVGLLLRIGALLRDRLDNSEDAVDAYRRVLDINDNEPSALAAISDLYRTSENWTELYAVVRTRSEIAESDDERMAHLRDLADLAETRLDNHEDAIELWEDVLGIRHDDLDAMRHILRLQGQAGNHEAVVEAIERELNTLGESDPDRSADLHRRMGRLWMTELDDALNAQDSWTRLLAIRENDIEALRALEGIHEESENHDALAGVLMQMVESLQFEGDDLLALYQKLARLWSDGLPEPERAIWAWQKVREQTPDDLEPVNALERLFSDEAKWDQAVQIMRVKAEMVGPEAAVEVWLALGEIQQFQLQVWEAAADSYSKILETAPGHDEAAERLDAIYSEHEQWHPLSDLLAARAEYVEDAEDKRDIYLRLSDIFENRLEEPGVALLYLQAAHVEAAGDIDVLSSIERVAGITEQWQDLLDQYLIAIEAFDDNEDKIDFGMRSARLLRDKLERDDEAVGQYRGVLELDAEHEEALQELSALLEKTSAWADLVQVMETRFANATDAFDRAEIGLKIGQVLADMLGDVGGATEAYQRVLDSGESDEKSVAALEKIHTDAQNWPELIKLLEHKAGNGLGDETQIRLEIGRIMEQELQNIEGAIEVYEEILQFDDTQKEALDRLLELYAAADDMDRLTSVYERLLHTAETDEEQIQYCEALALLHHQVHENPESAADYYYRVLTIDTTNEASLLALEEIYEALEQWEDLIDIFRKRMEQVIGDEEAWAGFKLKSAVTYRDRLEDPDNAIYAYQELIDRVPGHRGALDALEALFRSNGEPEQVQDILQKKAAAATDDEERIALMCDRAEIVLSDLADPDGALDILNQALAIQDGHDRALKLLENVYRSREEWENVIEALRKRDLFAQSEKDKAAVQVAIADVYRDHLSDGMLAVEHYERAMQIIPDDVATAERLANLYVIAEDWVKAEALLRLIVEKADADESDDARRAEQHYHLGQALQHCLRPEEALAEYQTAHALAPGDVDVTKALGTLAYETGDFERAEEIYTELIDAMGVDAEESELVDLYKTLGQIAFGRGESAKALEYLEKTVQLQPGSTEALESLIDLCEQEEYWQGIIDYAAELRDLKEDSREKFALQLRIGDTYLKRMSAPHDAVAAYKQALEYQQSKAAYLKIFTTLVEAEVYDDAIETLDRLVGIEQDDKRKAQYLGAAGDIFREKLEDHGRAVEFYNRALDHDPSLLKLFRFVDEILTRDKDWKALQKNYRNMLKRVQGDDSQIQLQYKLAFNLGEIYRTRLKQMEKAKAAFELARDIKGKDVKTLQILSELYEVDEDFDAAIATERELLSLNPGKVDHYRHLKRLFFDQKDEDSAWVACAVLHLLGQANEREEDFYQEYATPEMVPDAATPEADIWVDALLSHGEDLLLGRILHDIYQGIGDILTQTTLKTLKLKKKNLVDLSQKEQFTHVFRNCARVLGVNPAPAAYHQSAGQGLVIRDTVPPIVVIGDDLRAGRTEQQLAFVLAKAMTYFHPLHIAVCVAEQATLETLLKAAIKLFVPDYNTGGMENTEAFQSVMEALADMPAQLRNSLGGHIAAFVERNKKPNVTRWINQIELSANHAALLLCNDPVMAGKFIKSEANRPLFTAPGRLSTRDKLMDLATYALSAEYIGLRKSLSIHIDQD